MKKTKKRVDVIKEVVPITQSSNPPIHQSSDAATAKQLMDQYAIVVAAERASFRERVKFGAMLILWEQYLGEGRGGATNGQRGTSGGEGLKGWLEQNCPAISYVSAMAYKDAAKRAVAMLGGGAMATAALLGESEVTQPGGEVVEVSAQIIEKRDSIFEDATSRRKLEQMYFDFMKKDEKRAESKKVAKTKLAAVGGKVLSAADSAAILWGGAMAVFEAKRGAFFSAARDLNVNLAEGWLEELKMLVEVLEKRVKD